MFRLVNGSIPPFAPPVGLLNSLEKHVRWISFPGLLRGIVILQFFTFVLLAFRPEAYELLLFDWPKILTGEIWRLLSFIFIPIILPGSTISYIFIIFMVMIGFLIADSLESTWGSFRASLFCYGIILCQLVANILFHKHLGSIPLATGSAVLDQALFFAFATYFPRYEFRMMLLFPIPVFIIAIVNAAWLGMIALSSSMTQPYVAVYLLICFAPYLVWAVPMLLRYLRTRADVQQRQAAYQARQMPAGAAFHTCDSCGATDLTHPDREFRMTEQDGELCNTCLDEQH